MFFAEQALGPEQQEDEREHVRKPALDAAADKRPQVDLGQLLGGTDDETAAKWDRRTLDLTLVTMKMAFDLSGGAEWGKSTREQFARLKDIFLRGRLIAKKLVNPADYIISVPDFFQKTNTFDHDGIVAQAKGCDVKM